MSNSFYNHGSIPADNSLGSSAEIRAEFDSVGAAFDKMPTLTSNGGKLVKINAGATALEAQATDAFVADAIHAATSKTTPVDADEFGIVDSAASNVLKKLTWANLKATLKTYFDALYHTVGGALGTPASGTLTNCTGLPPTGLSSTTGSGAAVLANSPTLVTPNLGTPSALVGTNITGTASALSIGGNAATATSATNATNATNVYQERNPVDGTYLLLLGNGNDAAAAVNNFTPLYFNSTTSTIEGAHLNGNAATATTATSATTAAAVSTALENVSSVSTSSSSIISVIVLSVVNTFRLNYAGTHTTTLPDPATHDGAAIRIISYNGAVVSASSNVTPLSGGAAGTAILSGAGKWAKIVADSTSGTWVIVEAN